MPTASAARRQLMSTRLVIWLAGSVSVVAPCDWVFSVKAASGPLCVIAPAGALRLRLATWIAGRFRLPLAWVMLALAPPPKFSVPPVWLKLELTVRLFAMFKRAAGDAQPGGGQRCRFVVPAAAS